MTSKATNGSAATTTNYTLCVCVVEGTAKMSPYIGALMSYYLDPILKQLSDDTSRKTDPSQVHFGLVIYGDYMPSSPVTVDRKYFTADLTTFQSHFIDLPFQHGGILRSCANEALVGALELFDEFTAANKPTLTPKRHVILISNSIPYTNRVRCNLNERYDDFNMLSVSREMKKLGIHFSLIAPRKGLSELESMYKMMNASDASMTNNARPMTDHCVYLADLNLQGAKNSKLDAVARQFLHNAVLKRAASITTSAPPDKKVKVENNSPDAEQTAARLQLMKQQQATFLRAQAAKAKHAQQTVQDSNASNGTATAPFAVAASPSGMTSDATAQLQAQLQNKAAGAIAKPTAGQAKMDPVQLQQQLLQAQLAAADNVAKQQEVQRQQNILFLQQQQVQQQEHVARNQANLPVSGANADPSSLQASAATSSPSTQAPLFTAAQIAFLASKNINVASLTPAQQQMFLDQLNKQVNQQRPVGAANANPTAATANAAVAMQARQTQQTQQQPQQYPISGTANAAQTMPTPQVTNPSTSNLPIWQGQIVWHVNDPVSKQKREFACQVAALPNAKPNSNNAMPTVQELMLNVWPIRLEITGLMHARMPELQKLAAIHRLPYVTFVATGQNRQQGQQPDANTQLFHMLAKNLDTKKMVASIRFSTANANGSYGLVLIYTGGKLIGLLFLKPEVPIPDLNSLPATPQQSTPQAINVAPSPLQNQDLSQQLLNDASLSNANLAALNKMQMGNQGGQVNAAFAAAQRQRIAQILANSNQAGNANQLQQMLQDPDALQRLGQMQQSNNAAVAQAQAPIAGDALYNALWQQQEQKSGSNMAPSNLLGAQGSQQAFAAAAAALNAGRQNNLDQNNLLGNLGNLGNLGQMDPNIMNALLQAQLLGNQNGGM